MVSFALSSFLRSPCTELDLLRKLADVLIVNLCPRPYVDNFLLRHALREVLACQGSFITLILSKEISFKITFSFTFRSTSTEYRFIVRP